MPAHAVPIGHRDGGAIPAPPSKSWLDIAKQSFSAWSADRVPTLGAALAYYSAFSLAPLLVISVGLIGFFLSDEAATGELQTQLQSVMGPAAAKALGEVASSTRKPEHGVWATLIGVITLFIGASGVFGQLQDSLNLIWKVERDSQDGWWHLLRDRFFSFSLVLGSAFLLLVSLLLSAAINAFFNWAGGLFPLSEVLLKIGNGVLAFLIVTVLFGMIFKFVPDVQIGWKDVWLGALVTSILFSIGKWGLGLYLGSSAVASGYGAAGSFVLILLWVYYSSQILFLGAEFTRVYAHLRGSHRNRDLNSAPVKH